MTSNIARMVEILEEQKAAAVTHYDAAITGLKTLDGLKLIPTSSIPVRKNGKRKRLKLSPSPMQERILAILEKSKKPLTSKQVAGRMKRQVGTVTAALSQGCRKQLWGCTKVEGSRGFLWHPNGKA